MKDEKKVEMKFWEELGRKIGKKGSDDDGWWKGLLDYYSNFYFFNHQPLSVAIFLPICGQTLAIKNLATDGQWQEKLKLLEKTSTK